MVVGLDLYSLLGIPRDATPEEIRSAYFDAARKFHPDANPDPLAREQFLAIQNAYEVLSNPDKKEAYDSTLPNPPTAPKIAINVKFSRNVIPLLTEPQLVYALVELTCTGEPDPTLFPPHHICLVLDRSTSMNGERIDMVKANVTQLLRSFRPLDMLSIVTFSDRAEVVIPLGRIADLAKAESKISMIATGGGTEIFSGLEVGLGQLQGFRGIRAIRTLILLTDGHTYGDEKACLTLAERAASEGITLNALGIGNEWNDAFLDNLTSISGGSAFYVTSAKDLYKLLEQKMTSSVAVYARGITLEYSSPPSVLVRYAFRLGSDAGLLQTTSPIAIGDLLYGKTLSFLLEFYISNLTKEIEQITFADGKLRMDIPSQADGRSRIFLDFSRPVAENPEVELPHSAILDALSHLSLYRLQEKARQEVEAGEVAQASRRLQYLATHLLSIGDRELAHTVLVEAEHIQQSRHFSKDGDKRIKYGTRSLFLPSGMEHE
jgi:Ca-activated chloride channel family protein